MTEKIEKHATKNVTPAMQNAYKSLQTIIALSAAAVNAINWSSKGVVFQQLIAMLFFNDDFLTVFTTLSDEASTARNNKQGLNDSKF